MKTNKYFKAGHIYYWKENPKLFIVLTANDKTITWSFFDKFEIRQAETLVDTSQYTEIAAQG